MHRAHYTKSAHYTKLIIKQLTRIIKSDPQGGRKKGSWDSPSLDEQRVKKGPLYCPFGPH